jgi:predicted nucleotidyltransferase
LLKVKSGLGNLKEGDMGINELLKEKREEILRVATKHGARNVRIFGSTVRGEAGPESDVDFLVDVEPVHSSWFPAGLILDLEELLGKKVDVVTEDSIYWLLRRRILKEARPL